MSSVSTYDALKETLTFQYQIHINFPASARVPFFLNTIMDPEPEATLISEVFTRTAKNTFFSPLEWTRWCIRYQIFLPKFPQGWITKSSLLYVTHLIFDYPLPLLPCHSLCKKTPTGRTMFCSWSHSDVFAFCLCVSYRHKKLQCFPAHHMHLTKISVY